jgi:hypothetical protein
MHPADAGVHASCCQLVTHPAAGESETMTPPPPTPASAVVWVPDPHQMTVVQHVVTTTAIERRASAAVWAVAVVHPATAVVRGDAG